MPVVVDQHAGASRSSQTAGASRSSQTVDLRLARRPIVVAKVAANTEPRNSFDMDREKVTRRRRGAYS
ncbi:hypothetical protein QYF36_004218 [Acer negundo]|nr:hypothetical protein QYF36_004218 [Acer negundo]